MITRCSALALALALAAPALAQTNYYVNGACGNDAWTGLSPVCAAPDGPRRTIQPALDTAASGDTVTVADGLYTGPGNRDLRFAGRNIILRSSGGPLACVIDCENAAPGIVFFSSETRAALVEGFTFTRGRPGFGGGAMQFSHVSSPTVRNCIFNANGADEGGALYLDTSSSPLIERCRFTANQADFGGAIRVFGEGISSAEVVHCLFLDNHAALDGGAVYCEGPSPRFVNCLIAANTAGRDGGGLFGLTADPDITSCTIVANAAGQRGGGIVGAGATFFAEMRNTVVWGNAAPLGRSIALLAPPFYGPATLTVARNIVEGGQGDVHVDPNCTLLWGPGNLAADPLFVGAADYRLSPGSPAIDAADNTALPPGILTDLDGNPRFVDDPQTPDSGVPGGAGGAAIADIGVYEFQPCYPDCNVDGALNLADFGCFQTKFALADPYADCNGDGALSLADFGCFQTRFALGCP